MHFDPDSLFKKIQTIVELQNNPDYMSAADLKSQQANAKRMKREARERLRLEFEAKKEQKIASAAMLQAQRMSRENKEQAEREASKKITADRSAKKNLGPSNVKETFWGSDIGRLKPVKKNKVKKTNNNFNGTDPSAAVLPAMAGSERRFLSRQLNLDEKVAVKLDAKTIVYAKPGYDLEELKKKYLRK